VQRKVLIPYRRLFPVHGEHGLDGHRDFAPAIAADIGESPLALSSR